MCPLKREGTPGPQVSACRRTKDRVHGGPCDRSRQTSSGPAPGAPPFVEASVPASAARRAIADLQKHNVVADAIYPTVYFIGQAQWDICYVRFLISDFDPGGQVQHCPELDNFSMTVV